MEIWKKMWIGVFFWTQCITNFEGFSLTIRLTTISGVNTDPQPIPNKSVQFDRSETISIANSDPTPMHQEGGDPKPLIFYIHTSIRYNVYTYKWMLLQCRESKKLRGHYFCNATQQPFYYDAPLSAVSTLASYTLPATYIILFYTYSCSRIQSYFCNYSRIISLNDRILLSQTASLPVVVEKSIVRNAWGKIFD